MREGFCLISYVDAKGAKESSPQIPEAHLPLKRNIPVPIVALTLTEKNQNISMKMLLTVRLLIGEYCKT